MVGNTLFSVKCEYQVCPLDFWISNSYKQTIKKTMQIGFHSKRILTVKKMNDNIKMDSTIAGSVNAHS